MTVDNLKMLWNEKKKSTKISLIFSLNTFWQCKWKNKE